MIYLIDMKYNLLQKKHDKIANDFENNRISKEAYFNIEKLLELNRELFTINLN